MSTGRLISLRGLFPQGVSLTLRDILALNGTVRILALICVVLSNREILATERNFGVYTDATDVDEAQNCWPSELSVQIGH